MSVLFTSAKTRVIRLRNIYKSNRKYFWFVGIIFILFGFLIGQVSPPFNFPSNTYIHIQKGATVRMVADELAQEHIIHSPTSFIVVSNLTYTQKTIKAGIYHLSSPISLFTVVKLLKTGTQSIPIRVTFPEGITVLAMSPLISKAMPNVTKSVFLKLATPYEGYLFPDTYDFSSTQTALQVVKEMRKNFDTHIASITPYITTSGYSQNDVIIMASLLEKEARTLHTRRIIAGILFNRLRIGMPLQVDAVFGFIFNKPTYDPSIKDLHVKSPYNTYIHKGLPPTPIDNPGSDAIFAAATPIKTNYLYYITGKDGTMHYAKTLAQHERNIRKFLR